MKHSLIRTSPKGKDFVGDCITCGRRGVDLLANDCTVEITDEQLVLLMTGDFNPGGSKGKKGSDG